MRPIELLATTIITAVAVTAACSDQPPPVAPPSRLAAASASAQGAGGVIILRHPGETPGPPYYADITSGFVPNDGRWAGIVFWRSPECVPAGFNLLEQFNPPTAFACPLTLEGEGYWRDLSDAFPFQQHERGLGAVPVYFVAWSELQAAMGDGVLTIGELQGLPSLLVGSASFLRIVTHNSSGPGSQGINHGQTTLVAGGELADGRAFQFRYVEQFLPETGEHVLLTVTISFR